MAGGGGGGEGEPEFQVAPMIDVLLVLLIFFMTITSAQVLRVDKSITLPVANNALKKDNQRAEGIINVGWDGKKPIYRYNDTVFPNPELIGPLLKPLHDADPKFRVVIRGDENATAESVSRVMDAAGNAGVSDISFSTLNHR